MQRGKSPADGHSLEGRDRGESRGQQSLRRRSEGLQLEQNGCRLGLGRESNRVPCLNIE